MNSDLDVKILGAGCDKCEQLLKNTSEALTALGVETSIEHVTDFMEIAAYGVMSTPTLMVDGHILCQGRVLKSKEIQEKLKNYFSNME